MTDTRRYDVLIIGGGQAGPSLAHDLAKRGQRVALAERKDLGGSCVNFGCTPTKAAIASARVAHDARRAADFGLTIPTVTVDFAAVLDRARRISWAAVNGALFEFGASFADPGTVVATFFGRLTPGTTAVGAATAIARFGWLLPQLFAARYAQGVEYRKPIYLVGGWGRAGSLGALAAVLLLWDRVDEASGVALTLFFLPSVGAGRVIRGRRGARRATHQAR